MNFWARISGWLSPEVRWVPASPILAEWSLGRKAPSEVLAKPPSNPRKRPIVPLSADAMEGAFGDVVWPTAHHRGTTGLLNNMNFSRGNHPGATHREWSRESLVPCVFWYSAAEFCARSKLPCELGSNPSFESLRSIRTAGRRPV